MNTKLKLTAALLAASVTSVANAGIVTQWNYDNQAGFNNYVGETGGQTHITATGNSASGSTDFIGGPYSTKLEWGTPVFGSNKKSNLDIDSAVLGSVTTNSANYVNGTDITHNNFEITSNSVALDKASVIDGLRLTPTAWTADASATVDPDNLAPYTAPTLAFGIDFFESPNRASTCANGLPNNTGDNVNGCGDIFEITGLAALGITPVIGNNFIEFSVPFFLTTGDAAWDKVQYIVTTRLSGLSVLPAEYTCKSGPTCFGFVTKEERSNVLQAQFKIRTVPEPAAIALFGLGLIATGFAGRRRRKL